MNPVPSVCPPIGFGFDRHIANRGDCLDDDDDPEHQACVHCNAKPLVVFNSDDDDRCVMCFGSHRVCDDCGDFDANTCIHCDTDYCEGCWQLSVHRESCEHAAKQGSRP